MPEGLPGYTVTRTPTGSRIRRLIRTAPNGDLFVAETGPGRIRVLRGRDAAGKAQEMEVFAADLNRPFGIAFYPAGPNPQFVYVGNTDSMVRFPYQVGDLKARGPKEMVVTGAFPGGGHSTRDIVFSPDGKKMFVGVGLALQRRRPGHHARREGSRHGPRVQRRRHRPPRLCQRHPQCRRPGHSPDDRAVWVSTNERDNLGDNLVPDYISHIEDGGFYGWPWYYLGGNQDPRHEGKHPGAEGHGQGARRAAAAAQRAARSGLLRPASSSRRSIAPASSPPHTDRGTAASRTGYKVDLRVPLNNGAATRRVPGLRDRVRHGRRPGVGPPGRRRRRQRRLAHGERRRLQLASGR